MMAGSGMKINLTISSYWLGCRLIYKGYEDDTVNEQTE